MDSKALLGLRSHSGFRKSVRGDSSFRGLRLISLEMALHGDLTQLSLSAGSVRRARPAVCLRQRFLSDPRGRRSSPLTVGPQKRGAQRGCGSKPLPGSPRNPGPSGARSANFRPLPGRGGAGRGVVWRGGADVRRAAPPAGRVRLPLPAACGHTAALACFPHDALAA